MRKHRIRSALRKIQREMEVESNGAREGYIKSGSREPFYHGGLSSEGYVGGYRDALYDVLLVLDKITPDRRGWWGQD